MNITFSILKPEHYDQIISLWEKAGLEYRPKGRDTRENIYKQLKLCVHELRRKAKHVKTCLNDERLSRFLERRADELEEKIQDLINEYSL